MIVCLSFLVKNAVPFACVACFSESRFGVGFVFLPLPWARYSPLCWRVGLRRGVPGPRVVGQGFVQPEAPLRGWRRRWADPEVALPSPPPGEFAGVLYLLKFAMAIRRQAHQQLFALTPMHSLPSSMKAVAAEHGALVHIAALRQGRAQGADECTGFVAEGRAAMALK